MNDRQRIITEPAANFRALAREGIRGRWGDAFLKGLFYILLLSLPTLAILALTGWLGLPDDNLSRITDAYTLYLSGEISQEEYMRAVMDSANASYMLSYLYQLFVSGALTFGVTTVYLRYRRKQEAPTELLFSGFSQYSRSLALFLLMAIFTCLWTLCLIIPGIIAYYRYRLAFFILVDNPNIGPLEAINISKELMRGNKWKLFCLDLSFIGWALVAWIVVVMSMLFLTAIVVGASTYSTDSILLLVIVQTAIISVVTGVLYMYMGTASAAFYERASGLLRYTDEVAPPSAGGSGFYG